LHEPGPPELEELPPKLHVPFGGVVWQAPSPVRWLTGTPPLEPPDELLDPLLLPEPLLDVLPELPPELLLEMPLDDPLLPPELLPELPPDEEPLLPPLELPPLDASLPASDALNVVPPHAHATTSPAASSAFFMAGARSNMPASAPSRPAGGGGRATASPPPRHRAPPLIAAPRDPGALRAVGRPSAGPRQIEPLAAFFSFFFFCFSLVESFGLLSLRAFSIPLAMADPSVGSHDIITHARAFVHAESP
jgi:hypothetical protein